MKQEIKESVSQGSAELEDRNSSQEGANSLDKQTDEVKKV